MDGRFAERRFTATSIIRTQTQKNEIGQKSIVTEWGVRWRRSVASGREPILYEGRRRFVVVNVATLAFGAAHRAVSTCEDNTAYEGSRTFTDRIWLVQCKRERSIGPSKLASYLDKIPEDERNRLHGIIFAACADFSKRTRDVFREWCAAHGVQDFYLWGKAELEDALFRPQNDHLLFAYFGLSLAIRRRSDQARLRSQTTIKRKLTRAIAESREVLLRDVKDENYPYTDTSDANFKWWVFARPKMTFRGLELVARRDFGYIADDGEHWDVANVVDDTRLSEQKDPWRGSDNLSIERRELFEFWDKLSDYNKAWFETRGVVPFASIVEIDEVGDDLTPHLNSPEICRHPRVRFSAASRTRRVTAFRF